MEPMEPNREAILSGSIELSSGTRVSVRVIMDCPMLTREEVRELENTKIALHDLTPIRVPKLRSA